MTSFRLTRLALSDLRSIGRYTQQTWEKEQRDRYPKQLDAIFHLLAKQ
jgi:toxin ParE1/3/4